MLVAQVLRGASLLLLFAAPAGATPAEDCRNRDLADEARVAACSAALPAATDDRDRADLLLYRGATQTRLGRPDLAEADYAEAERLAPDWADPLVERAYDLRDAGQHEAAADEAVRALSREPGSLYALQAAMDIFADAGRTEACLDLAAEAFALGPEDAVNFANRGRCLYESGRVAASISDYRRAIELGEDEAYVRSNLARALLETGRAEEALPEARRAVELDPADWLGVRNLAVALLATGDVDGALATLRQHGPGLGDARRFAANDVAWHLFLAGRAAEGMAVFEEAFGEDPWLGDADQLDTYGHLLAALGMPDGAALQFVRAAEVGGPERLAHYERRLTEAGFPPNGNLHAALLACARRVPDCRLHD